jgi:hypothetical protein
MRSQQLAASIVLVALAAAPFALAQSSTPPKKKKGAKPAASASASVTAAADTTPAPPPPPPPPPAESAEPAPAKELPATPLENVWDTSNTAEDPTKPYYFLGLRYRGTIIPKFLENLFVNDGGTVYSNTVALELDIRKDGHSTIPWIGYTGFGFGDTLFFQKGKPDEPNNYSDVSSSLWALFLGLDELWSVPMDQSHHWDFEYGFGVGLGIVFGNLYNDWVYQTSDGTGLLGSNGNHYAVCPTTTLPANAANPSTTPGNDCSAAGHSNATVNKVGHYAEPNWFGGGSVPVIFPQITFPNLGIRYEPVKNFEARLGVGFSLTGFWFGISGNYGFEQPPKDTSAHPAAPAAPAPPAADPAKNESGIPGLRGTL